ncbi:hypothetical protein BV20DRAFT_698759 [Pilatotrama ljubarskyi]|nr:hypothetical protein BV20DRAFT_698759 [Pilatotrama ljubarskyi]
MHVTWQLPSPQRWGKSFGEIKTNSALRLASRLQSSTSRAIGRTTAAVCEGRSLGSTPAAPSCRLRSYGSLFTLLLSRLPHRVLSLSAPAALQASSLLLTRPQVPQAQPSPSLPSRISVYARQRCVNAAPADFPS